MRLEIALACLFAFVLSAGLTQVVRRFALSRGLLDTPNARSSHQVVTPRGGGLAMVLASVGAWLALAYLGDLPVNLLVALAGGGLAVAAVGFMDDRRPMPARFRLAVHVAAAIWALAWLGVPAVLPIGAHTIHLGWAGAVMATLGITWFLNLFNFMDGIDGIAASEAVFVTGAGAALALAEGAWSGIPAAGLVLAASCAGFLLWNWPPAKIFMGDVGSGYLGYAIGVLVLAATRSDPGAVWVWLILVGLFFVDATVTLVRRAVRGDRVSQAHRSHAYQWLARRWGSHKRVTLAVLALNLLWLFPCAWLAMTHSGLAVWMVGIGLAPLIVVVVATGAGRPETAASPQSGVV